MRRLSTIASWLMLVAVIGGLSVLSADDHEWMREIDPGIAAGQIVSTSDAPVFAGYLAFAGCLVAALCALSAGKNRRGAAAALAGVVIFGIWVAKFGLAA